MQNPIPQKINVFDDQYAFLSNFYPATVTYEGMTYLSSEAAYQAAKCTDPADRKVFQTLTPGKAKRLGQQVQLRKDWDQIKISVMTEILENKFQNPTLKAKLIETGNATLIEGNIWHDTFWGVDLNTGKGQNHLGILLMDLRTKLQKQP